MDLKITIDDIDSFDCSNIVFPEKCIWKMDDKCTWSKIYFKYVYPGGKLAPLVIQTPELQSFGSNSFVNNETGKTNHNISLKFFDKEERDRMITETDSVKIDEFNEKKEQEDKLILVFTKIIGKLQEYLKTQDTMKKLGKLKDKADWHHKVDRMTLLRFPTNKETGEEDKTSAPLFYSKIITPSNISVKSKEKPTFFNVVKTNEKGYKLLQGSHADEILPQLKGTRCQAFANIKFESIYVGDKPTIQIKASEINITTELTPPLEYTVVIPKRLQSVIKMFDSDEQPDECSSEASSVF